MKKLNFADINEGDWIYWVDYSEKDYFVSNVKSVDKKNQKFFEEWWGMNNALKKFDKINDHDSNFNFTKGDFKGYDIIRRMTKKEIEVFKNKLIVDTL